MVRLAYKVLFVSHESDLIGGSERSLLHIVEYFQKKSDVEVVVACPHEGELSAQLTRAGINVVTDAHYHWGTVDHTKDQFAIINDLLSQLSQVRELVMREKPDLIVTNTSVIPWFAYVSRNLGIPHVWFLREHLEESESILYPGQEEYKKFINDFSDKILVNSFYMKDYYQNLLHRSDIEVVYPSIDQGVLKFARSGKKPGEPIKFIVYGGIVPAKNQLEALKAANILRKKVTNFKLSIMGAVGDPDYYDSLVTYVRKNNLEEYVNFLPYSKEPYPIVAEHDVCIVPSLREPFGRVTVEAMLLKKAVIASNSGGSREIIAESGHGDKLLYESGSSEGLAKKMENFVTKPETIKAIGDGLHKFCVGRYINEDDLDNLYASVKKLASIKKNPTQNYIDELVINQGGALKHADVEIRRLNKILLEQDASLQSILNSKRWKLSSTLARSLNSVRRPFRKRR